MQSHFGTYAVLILVNSVVSILRIIVFSFLSFSFFFIKNCIKYVIQWFEYGRKITWRTCENMRIMRFSLAFAATISIRRHLLSMYNKYFKNSKYCLNISLIIKFYYYNWQLANFFNSSSTFFLTVIFYISKPKRNKIT